MNYLKLAVLISGFVLVAGEAAAQCRNGVCRAPSRQVIVRKQVAPVVVQKQASPIIVRQRVATVPATTYRVGSHLQRSAVATAELRESDEYLELQRLRGFREAIELLQREQASADQAAVFRTPRPTPATEHAEKFPRLVASCGRCHGGEEPKGDLWLDGSVDILSPEHAATRDAIVRNAYRGTMPPEHALDDETFGTILAELYSERSEENEP